MMPMTPQPAGLPSGSFGGRRRSPSQAGVTFHASARAQRLAGAALPAATALWWAAAAAAQAVGVALPWAVEPALAQALAGVLGLLPLLVLGVLFGAAPRRLALGAVPARLLSLPVALLSSGWVLALAGGHAARALAAVGVAMAAVGLALAAGLFGLLVLEAQPRPRRAGLAVAAGALVAVAALWATAVALALSRDGLAAALAAAAAAGGLWAAMGVVLAGGRRLPG